MVLIDKNNEKGKMTMKTMWEINYHWNDDAFSHYSVTPIKILRQGILATFSGCSKESITAISSDGRHFQGSADNYYNTESDAWEKVKIDLEKAIVDKEAQIKKITVEIDSWKKLLTELTNRKVKSEEI